MSREEGGKEKILAAIQQAAEELGRAPSRGELRRITGVSHYRVLAQFKTLREAVRAAGLEPNRKGEKISTEDLLSDWKRVAEKLGRRPSRAEYVREGKYSAGALTVRFGSWSGISTAKHVKGAKKKRVSGETSFFKTRRRTRIHQKPDRSNHKGHEETQRGSTKGIGPQGFDSDKAIAFQGARSRAAIPTPVVGMRRVTETVAQMVVNTLLAPGKWHLAISQSQNQEFNHKVHEGSPSRAWELFAARGLYKEGDLDPALAVKAPLVQDDDLMRRDLARRGLYKDRPVMGEPFDRRPMTNAPVNELGVMVLFGMVAWPLLGLQVESVQGRFPDCVAKRQVAPGKWQHLRIEFEYESKNFKLHGHDPKGCDMIVCWRHNWKDIPADLEVIELCQLFG